jgi:hypothetical protein
VLGLQQMMHAPCITSDTARSNKHQALPFALLAVREEFAAANVIESEEDASLGTLSSGSRCAIAGHVRSAPARTHCIDRDLARAQFASMHASQSTDSDLADRVGTIWPAGCLVFILLSRFDELFDQLCSAEQHRAEQTTSAMAVSLSPT